MQLHRSNRRKHMCTTPAINTFEHTMHTHLSLRQCRRAQALPAASALQSA